MKELRKSNVNFGKTITKDDKYLNSLLKTAKKARNIESTMNLTSRKTKAYLKTEITKENDDPNIVRKFTFNQKTSKTNNDSKDIQFVSLNTNRVTNKSIPEVRKLEFLNDDIKTAQIKVVARFRNENELEKRFVKDFLCVEYMNDTSVVISNGTSGKTEYNFDAIYNGSTDQISFYKDVASPTIEEVLKGYNGTIFTYGQSGSGKTYTIFGDDIFDDHKKGIIPRSMYFNTINDRDQIFSYIENENNDKIEFQLKFSILEIYKETLYDLLSPIRNSNSQLKIKEDPKKGIFVENLSEPYIEDKEELLFLLDSAEENRYVNETKLNKNSSRSHIVFILHILQKMPDGVEKKGILNLIDLAGSERVAKTGAIGETLEEAKKINSSLSCLGNVINCLSSGNGDFIPYRESKLTRLLKDSLGGNFKTTLVVTCSPHVYNYEETISSLNFAKRAKKIKNKVKINIKRDPEVLERIISSLQDKLRQANDEIMKLSLNNTSNAFLKTCLSMRNQFSSSNRNIENADAKWTENNITSSHIVTTDDESKVNNLSIKKTISINESQEEINRLKDQLINLKHENKLLKMKNIDLENLLNIDKVVETLQMSIEHNIKNIERVKESKSNEEIFPQIFLENLSNLNKNFNEYLELLEDVKRYKGVSNKINPLMTSINGEGSFLECHKRRFIKEVSKTSKKRFTSKGIISQMLSHHKYSQDMSNCFSHKAKESVTDIDQKEMINTSRGNRRNCIPLPLGLNLEKLEQYKGRDTRRDSANETLSQNIHKALKTSFFNIPIQRNASRQSNNKDDFLSSHTSLFQKDDACMNELRMLRKQKQVNTAYISSLLEELKEIQKQYKELEYKYRSSEDFFLKKHNCRKNVEFTFKDLLDFIFLNSNDKKELIARFLEILLMDSLLATKKIDSVIIKIHDHNDKHYEIIFGSGLNMKNRTIPVVRNLKDSLNGDMDSPEI